MILLILLSPLFFTFVPMVARGWPSLLGIIAVCGGFLAWVWLLYGASLFDSREDPGLNGLFAFSLISIATLGFVIMCIARGLGLLLRRRAPARRFWWVEVAGLVAAAAVPFLPLLYDQHVARRPPPAACLERPLTVDIAGTVLSLPHSEALALYLADGKDTARYLSSAEHHRDLCRRTAAGPIPLAVAVLRFDKMRMHGTCEDAGTVWGREICAARRDDFPKEVALYRSGAVTPRGFGFQEPTLAAWQALHAAEPWREGGVVVEAAGRVARYADGFLVEAGGGRAAACRTSGKRLYCEVDEIRDGLGLHWSFTTDPAGAAEDFLRLAGWIDALLASLTPSPAP